MNTKLNLSSCQRFVFQTLNDLYREEVVEEELVCRMARKWEKVVDKTLQKHWGVSLVFLVYQLIGGMKSFISL